MTSVLTAFPTPPRLVALGLLVVCALWRRMKSADFFLFRSFHMSFCLVYVQLSVSQQLVDGASLLTCSYLLLPLPTNRQAVNQPGLINHHSHVLSSSPVYIHLVRGIRLTSCLCFLAPSLHLSSATSRPVYLFISRHPSWTVSLLSYVESIRFPCCIYTSFHHLGPPSKFV